MINKCILLKKEAFEKSTGIFNAVADGQLTDILTRFNERPKKKKKKRYGEPEEDDVPTRS